MTLLKNKPAPARRSLESFKASAAVVSVKAQVQMITGGAMDGCHPPKLSA